MKLSTMKSVGALALVLLVSSMVVGQAIAGWEMTWHDEFDGTRLDGSKWDIESNCWGGGNNEQQCYTNRASNVYVSNGALHLKPIAGTYRGTDAGCTSNNEDSCTWTQPATSGRVRTKNAVDGSWKYGRFEVRAKLPKGDFLWPAIWMLPTDNVYGTWAGSGEIDIMESRGQNPSKVSSALHYGGQYPNNRHVGTGDINFPGVDFTAGYHVFACEWNANEIKMYVDNRLTWTQTLKRSFGTMYSSDGKPFDQKFHMLLNVAVAGGFFNTATYGTFNIDRAGPTWTSPMQIDYVRVYKWTDAPAPTPIAPAPVPHAPAPTPIAPTPVHTPVTPPTTGGQCGSVVFPLYPVHDTYSEQLRPGTSFGRDTTLKLRGIAPNQPGVAYLKFNLPKDRTPTRAMLSLYGSLEEPIDGSKSVFIRGPIDNDWSQETLTHDNRPAITCTNCPSVSVHVDNDIGWYTWDVLPHITKAIQAGKDVVSFSVALSYSGHVTFNSNDAATNKPVLNLSY